MLVSVYATVSLLICVIVEWRQWMMVCNSLQTLLVFLAPVYLFRLLLSVCSGLCWCVYLSSFLLVIPPVSFPLTFPVVLMLFQLFAGQTGSTLVKCALVPELSLLLKVFFFVSPSETSASIQHYFFSLESIRIHRIRNIFPQVHYLSTLDSLCI